MNLDQYLPHGVCFSWDPYLLKLHIISDLFIAIAYFSIPAGIIWAVSRKKELTFAPVYYLFAAFILACGVTHVLGIYTLWNPAYYTQGWAKAFTAVVSVITAAYLLPKLPKILALPSLNDLSHINAQLSDKINAQRIAEEKLTDTTKQLEQALRVQGDFLVNMSHEVRTPMTGVLGCLNLLEKESLTPNQRDLVDDAQMSAKNLLLLLNSVLDLSKMDADELTLSPSPVDLNEFVSDSVKGLRQLAVEKRLKFSSQVQMDHDDYLVVDPVRLRQVVQNLITNAIKFTDEGEVNVWIGSERLEGNQNRLCIRVSDTGPGVPEDARGRIFEKFYQVDGSSTRKGQGAGLGLAICKKLIELMGGTIVLKEAQGGGCLFEVIVDLPLQGRSLIARAGAPTDGKFALEDDVNRAGLDPVFIETTEGRADQTPCRILVVDDVPVNRKIVQRLLDRLGFESEAAENGQAALELLSTKKFDLVLMDCQMPVMDGYQATEMIRSGKVNGLNPNIPVIALTGHATKHDKTKCLLSGMNEYLVKPLEIENFLRLMKRILSGHLHVSKPKNG